MNLHKKLKERLERTWNQLRKNLEETDEDTVRKIQEETDDGTEQKLRRINVKGTFRIYY